MDRRILTNNELVLLRQFIISRSARFAEPAILLEIMDHFACKTEEVLNGEPGLSFEEAMKKAHKSFGIKGFAPIAEAYEKSIYNRYKQSYKQERRSVLTSFHVVGIILVGLFFGQAFFFLRQTNWFGIDGIVVIFLMEIIYVACIYFQRHSDKVLNKHSLFYTQAQEISSGLLLWLWVGLVCIPSLNFLEDKYTAIIIGILSFILTLNLLVHFRLMKKVRKDILEVEQQLQLL